MARPEAPITTGYAPAPTPPTRKRRRRTWRTWVGMILLLAGLALAGVWVWNTFVTTWLIRGAQQEAITSFLGGLPEANNEIAPLSALHTDFDAFPPPVVDLSALAPGDPFGVLTVPSWQGQEGLWDETLRNMILVKQGAETEAATNLVLNTGAAAHYVETAGPGELGNFSISAHRRSYGDNFLYLTELGVGYWVLLETPEAWYVYRVIGDDLVLPTDTHVIDPDPFSPVGEDGMQVPTRRLITLTTCTLPNGSPWGNSHRWIVHGELYGWMERSAGIPPMIDHYWDEAQSPLSQ